MAAGHHSLMGKKAYTGIHVHVNMTSLSGKYIKFITTMNSTTQSTSVVDWGDGNVQTYAYSSGDKVMDHTYASYGEYEIIMHDITRMGFRTLDGQAACAYDPAIISVIDYSGYITGSFSGAFKGCANFRCFIAPEHLEVMGQRDFANCPNFEEFVGGPISIYYDGTFQNCSKLTKFTVDYGKKPGNSATCWHNVWNGCSSLVELHLGNISQIGNNCLAGCSSLEDVFIDNHTVAEIKNSFYSSYKFPWGASSIVKFHGTDGYVLGNGTIVAG